MTRTAAAADEQAAVASDERDTVRAPAQALRLAAYPAQVVYQRCPDCHRARVATEDGFVEVEPREIDRHEGCAEPVVVDGPTPPALRRRILAREGQRCANPRCHHRADHCHHIVFRSQGGRSELWNEVAVCTTCHALIHAGLLRVAREQGRTLQWTPAAVADVVPEFDPGFDRPRESAIVDAPAPSCDVGELAQGLVRLGIPAGRSRELIGDALRALPAGQRTEANILRAALAARRVGPRDR